MVYEYFNLRDFSVEEVVNEIYDFSKIGAISIPGFLSERAREDLVRGAKFMKKLFREAPRVVGEVTQEVETLYIEDLEHGKLDGFSDSIQQFRREYENVYRSIAQRAGFNKHTFNSIGINYYPKNSQGITPHRDYERDRDLVSTFVLDGNAVFGVCRDREKTGFVELESLPGSIILMRAARNDSEQKYRPFHYIEFIQKDRLSLIVRRSLSLS